MPKFLLPICLMQCLWIAPTVLAEDKCEDMAVDVFTTSTQPVQWQADNTYSRAEISLANHPLDGIARFNANLSAGLSRDPEIAKRQVMQRFREVSSAERQRLQGTAEALALAIELNIRRYPAIVFNKRFVIYGVHDVRHAIRLYRAWCDGQAK